MNLQRYILAAVDTSVEEDIRDATALPTEAALKRAMSSIARTIASGRLEEEVSESATWELSTITRDSISEALRWT